ncbi:MAG: hypothetical protein JRN29_03025 [Nitrososphaerota archaeon]|nr:hypothetical protein [Nitrososphaerota archaeon]
MFFFLFLILSIPAGIAAAMGYAFYYVSTTGTVQAPSVTLVAGTAGNSSVLSTGTSASADVTAGYTFYENASAPTGTTATGASPSADTDFAAPSSSGSFTLSASNYAYLWSLPFPAATQVYAGSWNVSVWASTQKNTASMTIGIYTTDSSGAIVSTIATGVSIGPFGNSQSKATTTVSGGAGSVPAGGYVEVVLEAPPLGKGQGNYGYVTVYWGGSTPTSFSTVSGYDYVLKIDNPSSSSWYVDLAQISSSNAARLSNLTLAFNGTTQIAVGSALLSQQTMGTRVLVPASSVIYVEVDATATSFGTSTLAIALQVTRPPGGPSSDYRIDLSVG